MKKALVLAAAVSAVALPAAAAETYGLVVGVNDYQYASSLDGAVADASDIAASLKTFGAKEVKVLLNGQADRAGILAAWKDITAKAKKGDTIIFTYAGHGAQSKERVPGSEADGKDEFLVLPGFHPKTANDQRILDDDIAEMFKSVPDVKILFVADSCHSGTMTRSFGETRRKSFKTRNASFAPVQNDMLPPPKPEMARIEATDLPNVVSFSAVADHELDPEVLIDDKPRGALSWSLSRGLEGAADANHDGVITMNELESFVRENVRMQVEGQQHPQIAANTRDFTLQLKSALSNAGNKAVAAKTGAAAGSANAADAAPASGAPALVSLKVVNSPDAKALGGAVKGVSLVEGEDAPATLTWDVGTREILNQFGDGVAALPAGDGKAALGQVQAVVDKWSLVGQLKHDSLGHGLTIALTPGDKLYKEGEKAVLTVKDQSYGYFTLFALGSDGTVNFLYPLTDDKYKDPLEIPKDKPYTLDLVVQPPFGADHFVGISSDKPLTALHQQLKSMDGKPMAAALVPVLSKELAGQTYQLSIHGVYTAPKGS